MDAEAGGASKSPWTLVIGASSIVLSIVGMLARVLSIDLDRLEQNMKAMGAVVADNGMRIADRERDAAEFRGRQDEHLKKLDEYAERNRTRIEAAFRELDDKLQREMRLLDETTRTQVGALDTRVQAEFQRSLASIQAQIDLSRSDLRQALDTSRRDEDKVTARLLLLEEEMKHVERKTP